jgi:hypothetical protein
MLIQYLNRNTGFDLNQSLDHSQVIKQISGGDASQVEAHGNDIFAEFHFGSVIGWLALRKLDPSSRNATFWGAREC